MKRQLITGTLIAFPLVLLGLFLYNVVLAWTITLSFATLMVSSIMLVGHNKLGLKVSHATHRHLKRILHVACVMLALCFTVLVTSQWTE